MFRLDPEKASNIQVRYLSRATIVISYDSENE